MSAWDNWDSFFSLIFLSPDALRTKTLCCDDEYFFGGGAAEVCARFVGCRSTAEVKLGES